MTREEAINILDDYDVNFDGHTAEEIAEAFDMAFKALKQEPTDKSNLEKICEELSAENDDLRDQLAMRDRFKQESKTGHCDDCKYNNLSWEDLAYGEVNPDKMCQNCIFMKLASRSDGDDLCICTYDEKDYNVVEYTDYCDLWEYGGMRQNGEI